MDFLENKTLKHVLISICMLILLIFFVQMFHKASRPGGYDFTCFFLAAKAIAVGQSPYDINSVFNYIYPAFLSVCLIPLTFLPYTLANIVWFLFSTFCFFYGVRIILKRERNNTNNYIIVVSVAFLVFLNIIQNNLLNGQVNMIVLLLCLLFFDNYIDGSKIISVLFLALAISIKLVPGVFILYLLVRREWKMLFFAVLFCTCFIVLLPLVFLGQKLIPIYSSYFSFLLTSTASIETPIKDICFNLSNILAWFVPALLRAPLILKVIAVVFLCFVALYDYKYVTLQKNDRVQGFYLYLCLILLLSPISETHHLIYLLPGTILLINRVASQRTLFSTEFLYLIVFIVLVILGKIFRVSPFYFFAIILLLWYHFRNMNRKLHVIGNRAIPGLINEK